MVEKLSKLKDTSYWHPGYSNKVALLIRGLVGGAFNCAGCGRTAAGRARGSVIPIPAGRGGSGQGLPMAGRGAGR